MTSWRANPYLDDPDLDDPDLGDQDLDVPVLPPVVVPTAAELLDAAEGSVVRRRIVALGAAIGRGRPVDGNGDLGHDDAHDVARAVGLDAEGAEFALLLRWARAAGLVRTHKGRLVLVKGRAGLLGRPVELWAHLFDAFTDVGERNSATEPRFLHPLWDKWPQMFTLVQLGLYTAGGDPIPVELLVEVTLEAPVGMLGFAPWANPGREQRVEWHARLVEALAALESLGAIRTEPADDPEVEAEIRELSGRPDADTTLVALTPIGTWAVQSALVEQGVPAPSVGDLAGSGLPELAAGLAGASEQAVDAELAGWVARRGAERAAAEAGDNMTGTDVPAERGFATLVFTHCGEHGVAAARRVRAGGGIAGSVAVGWLLGVGGIEPDEVTTGEPALGVADQLCLFIEQDAIAEPFEDMPLDAQLGMLTSLAACGHPELPRLLDAIAAAPVHPKLAKAARKARHRLRR